MAKFTPRKPVTTETATVEVDAGLDVGAHRFSLSVVNAAGQASRTADEVVVQITQTRPQPLPPVAPAPPLRPSGPLPPMQPMQPSLPAQPASPVRPAQPATAPKPTESTRPAPQPLKATDALKPAPPSKRASTTRTSRRPS